MRTLAKILALSIFAGFAASAYAAPMGGGGGMGGDGTILPRGGAGGGSFGGHASGHVGGSFSGGASGGLAARPGGATGNFATRSQLATGSTNSGTGATFNGRTSNGFGGGDDWRRRHHHRGFFPGPVFGFGYGDNDYEPDVNQCWVLRRVYNARGLFVGWRHVDICAG